MSVTADTPRIVAVIPTHNSLGWLDGSLGALIDQEGVELTAVVVDNASTDGSPDHLRHKWPMVKVLQSRENRGYGAAVNCGAALVPDAHVLALNADAELQPGCLRRLVQVLEEEPGIGVVAPMLVGSEGRLQPSAHRAPALRRLLAEALLIDRVPGSPKVLDQHHRGYRYDRRLEIGWATGAVLLVRRKAWDTVHGFDPTYFMYAEEIDLQRRIGEEGWTALLEPAARAVHHGGKRPLPRERFLLAHEGFERLLAPRGGLRAASVRLVLSLTALTRGFGWSVLGAVAWRDPMLARRWATMFFGAAWGSIRSLPAAARRRYETTGRACYACGSVDNPVVAHEEPVEHRRGRPLLPEGVYRFARCRICGTLYVDSDVTEEHLATVYGEETPETAPDAAGLEHADLVAGRVPEFERHWAALTALRPATAGDRLVDVGCQTGDFGQIANRAGVKPNGVELSLEYAAIARQRWGPEAVVHCGPAEDAPMARGGYAYVTAFETLEHVLDPIAMLERMREWLAPDGLVAVSVPSSDYFHAKYWLLGEGPLAPWAKPLLLRRSSFYEHGVLPHTHIFSFTRRSLRRILERAGFEVVGFELTGWHGHFDPVARRIGRLLDYASRGGIDFAPSIFAIARPRPGRHPASLAMPGQPALRMAIRGGAQAGSGPPGHFLRPRPQKLRGAESETAPSQRISRLT